MKDYILTQFFECNNHNNNNKTFTNCLLCARFHLIERMMSLNLYPDTVDIISILQIEKLRQEKFSIVQSHITGKWQSQDWNPFKCLCSHSFFYCHLTILAPRNFVCSSQSALVLLKYHWTKGREECSTEREH